MLWDATQDVAIQGVDLDGLFRPAKATENYSDRRVLLLYIMDVFIEKQSLYVI